MKRVASLLGIQDKLALQVGGYRLCTAILFVVSTVSVNAFGKVIRFGWSEKEFGYYRSHAVLVSRIP